jgi:ComF family protein
MKIFSNLLQILFPRRCVVCRTQEPTSLCDDCLKEIPLVKNNKGGDIISVFPYRHPAVKYSIWEFKFKGNPDPILRLMPTIYDTLLDELTERHLFNNFQKPLLVPIPLHPERHKARGFNQAEQIAHELFKKNPEVFDINEDGLIRNTNTQPQAKIANRQQRRDNVRGCFEVIDPESFYNRNIILVDDITTTGSTLKEAIEVLNKAGARNVYAFTVAK